MGGGYIKSKLKAYYCTLLLKLVLLHVRVPVYSKVRKYRWSILILPRLRPLFEVFVVANKYRTILVKKNI